MKKIIVSILAGLALAVTAQAVTNVAQSIDSRALPADKFRDIINDRVYDVVNTDIPALVEAVNSGVITNPAFAGTTFSSSATQLVFSAASAAAATNTATPLSLPVRVNGTNYLLKLFLN